MSNSTVFDSYVYENVQWRGVPPDDVYNSSISLHVLTVDIEPFHCSATTDASFHCTYIRFRLWKVEFRLPKQGLRHLEALAGAEDAVHAFGKVVAI